MSYLPILEEKKTSPFGEKIKINFNTYSEDLSDENGSIYCFVSVFLEGKSIEYSFSIPNEGYSESWYEKFENAFLYNKDFREQFKSESENDSIDFEVIPKIPAPTELQKKDKSIELQRKINKINKKGGKFKDFMNLKSGRDGYSSLKKNKIVDILENDILNNKEITNLEEKEQLKVYRWVLRGLNIENSIKKVKIDLEVGNNFRRK
jgi:hypothetical protein